MPDVAISIDDIELPTIGSTLLGKYVLRRLIAKGGMGAVFEGEHNRLNQRVAVKILLPDMLKDQVVVERFSREARALASVRNPHVAAVYDVDFTPSGLPFMVMEFLEGDDLARVLSTDKTISDGTKIRWVCDVASALSEAHSLGIVHRDIKPANIILAKSGNQRIVKLVDFGVAKMLAEQSVELTQEAVAVGTPRYMSPEQLLALKTIDHRADIWSLGTTLYMMLANAAPFEAADTMQLMMAIVQQPFKPLAERRPDLPTELVELVEWTLRKSPDERPQTVAQWADALEPFATSRNSANDRRTSNPMMPRVTAPVIAVPAATGSSQMIPPPAVVAPPTSATQSAILPAGGKSKLPLQIGGAVALLALVAVGYFATRAPEKAVVVPPPEVKVEPVKVVPPPEVKVVVQPKTDPVVVAKVEDAVDAGPIGVDPAAQALAEAKAREDQRRRAEDSARRSEDQRRKMEDRMRQEFEEKQRKEAAEKKKKEEEGPALIL